MFGVRFVIASLPLEWSMQPSGRHGGGVRHGNDGGGGGGVRHGHVAGLHAGGVRHSHIATLGNAETGQLSSRRLTSIDLHQNSP